MIPIPKSRIDEAIAFLDHVAKTIKFAGPEENRAALLLRDMLEAEEKRHAPIRHVVDPAMTDEQVHKTLQKKEHILLEANESLERYVESLKDALACVAVSRDRLESSYHNTRLALATMHDERDAALRELEMLKAANAAPEHLAKLDRDRKSLIEDNQKLRTERDALYEQHQAQKLELANANAAIHDREREIKRLTEDVNRIDRARNDAYKACDTWKHDLTTARKERDGANRALTTASAERDAAQLECAKEKLDRAQTHNELERLKKVNAELDRERESLIANNQSLRHTLSLGDPAYHAAQHAFIVATAALEERKKERDEAIAARDEAIAARGAACRREEHALVERDQARARIQELSRALATRMDLPDDTAASALAGRQTSPDDREAVLRYAQNCRGLALEVCNLRTELRTRTSERNDAFTELHTARAERDAHKNAAFTAIAERDAARVARNGTQNQAEELRAELHAVRTKRNADIEYLNAQLAETSAAKFVVEKERNAALKANIDAALREKALKSTLEAQRNAAEYNLHEFDRKIAAHVEHIQRLKNDLSAAIVARDAAWVVLADASSHAADLRSDCDRALIQIADLKREIEQLRARPSNNTIRALQDRIIGMKSACEAQRSDAQYDLQELRSTLSKREEQYDSKIAAHVDHIQRIEKERDEAREIVNMVRTPLSGVWLWQGDGGNHPDSLSCPVVLSADMARFLAKFGEEWNKALRALGLP